MSEKDLTIAKQVLKQINERLGFLNNVGLGYLTLSRSAKTLSGGEIIAKGTPEQVAKNKNLIRGSF